MSRLDELEQFALLVRRKAELEAQGGPRAASWYEELSNLEFEIQDRLKMLFPENVERLPTTPGELLSWRCWCGARAAHVERSADTAYEGATESDKRAAAMGIQPENVREFPVQWHVAVTCTDNHITRAIHPVNR